jgi:hypothetical protein
LTPTGANQILARLPREDFALLEPHLEPVDLPVRKRLETGKRRIDQIYFIEEGLLRWSPMSLKRCSKRATMG